MSGLLKKVTVFLLVLVLVATFGFGCGNGDDGEEVTIYIGEVSDFTGT